MWAYRQMSRLDSGLTEDGRELCAELEAKLRVPVFYYLYKYSGRSHEMERKRLCPGCGKPWLMPEPHAFFAFQCKRCRLLSSKAVDFPAKAT
jgi:predicted  nucleic acid-binding Zn ribbon protein